MSSNAVRTDFTTERPVLAPAPAASVEIGAVTMSAAIDKLVGALAKAQTSLRPALKEATNPHFKSKYADLSAIWEAAQAVLPGVGIAVMQFPSASENRVTVQTMLAHESGQWITSSLTLTAQQATPQGIGSAVTYGRRYGLAAAVGVVADDDDDGNAASRRAEARANAATAEQVLEIGRLAAACQVDPDEASAKACGVPVAELQAAQAQKLIGLLLAKQRQMAREADASPAEDADEIEPAPEQVEAFNAAIDRDAPDDPGMPDEPLVSVPFSYTGAKASGRAMRTKMLGELLESIGIDPKVWLAVDKGVKRWRDISDDRVLELIEDAIRLERERKRVSPEKAADAISLLSERKVSKALITAKIKPAFRKIEELADREIDELIVLAEAHDK